jgi:hypothetical protein
VVGGCIIAPEDPMTKVREPQPQLAINKRPKIPLRPDLWTRGICLTNGMIRNTHFIDCLAHSAILNLPAVGQDRVDGATALRRCLAWHLFLRQKATFGVPGLHDGGKPQARCGQPEHTFL